MTASFPIDGNLTLGLVEVAKTRGLNASHVTYLGMAGAGDWMVTALAVERDLICVTADEDDYMNTYARQGVHPGPAIIAPDRPKDVQQQPFEALLDFLETWNDDPINKVIRIDDEGTITFKDWPEPTSEPATE